MILLEECVIENKFMKNVFSNYSAQTWANSSNSSLSLHLDISRHLFSVKQENSLIFLELFQVFIATNY